MKYKETASDRVLSIVVYTVIIFSMAITAYPLIYTFSMSISDPIYVASNEIFLLPKGFSLESYKMVFEDAEVWKSYYNTIWYTFFGTLLNVILTVVCAYPLSRKKFFLRRPLMLFVAITMFFSGGLIPFFILVKDLGLYNTRLAIILPVAISTWNLIICRSFFEGIDDGIEEAATIDGASQTKILFRIYLPLSMPIIAVLVLFYAVSHWNSYFSAALFLSDSSLHPIQIYLRKVLVLANSSAIGGKVSGGFERSLAVLQLKYSVVVVAALPILVVYPFVQKYFVKGVMVGAIKG